MHKYLGNHGMKRAGHFLAVPVFAEAAAGLQAALCRCHGRQDGVEEFLLGCVIIVRRASRSTSSSATSSWECISRVQVNQQLLAQESISILARRPLSAPSLVHACEFLRLMLLHATWETHHFLVTTGEREHLGVQKLH